MSSRLGLCLVGILALILVVPAAARVVPDQGDFLVHHTADSTPWSPVAAFARDGSSLVVWEDSLRGIVGQLYDPDGAALGTPRTLVPNSVPASSTGGGRAVLNHEPSVVFLPGGDFVLAWIREAGHLRVAPFFQRFVPNVRRVMVQRFGPSGEPAGRTYHVTSASGTESWPKLEVVPGGGLLAIWRSEQLGVTGGPVDGLFARELTRAGRPVSDELQLSHAGDEAARYATLTAGGGGRVLVAWEGCCDAGGDLGVFARVYDGSTGELGEILRLNGNEQGRQRRPALARAGDRGFLVLWQSELERSLIPIFGRFVDLAGNPLTAERQISHGYDTVQLAPAVAPMAGGGYLATWRDWYGAYFGISAVELGADGLPRGEHFRVNDQRIKKTAHTSLATDGAGTFLIPWETHAPGNKGIIARRLHSE
jgi:hypothetical protein